jgi:hypothetical protein
MLLWLCSPILSWQCEQTARRNEWSISDGQERAAKPDFERHWLEATWYEMLPDPGQADSPLGSTTEWRLM